MSGTEGNILDMVSSLDYSGLDMVTGHCSIISYLKQNITDQALLWMTVNLTIVAALPLVSSFFLQQFHY